MSRCFRLTRREFLRNAALAGAMVTPAKALTRDMDKSKPRKVIYRTVGRTGLKLPIVSMGSCYSVNLIRVALNEGSLHFQSSGA